MDFLSVPEQLITSLHANTVMTMAPLYEHGGSPTLSICINKGCKAPRRCHLQDCTCDRAESNLNDDGYEDDDDETSRPLMVAHSIDIAYSNDGILPDQVEKCKHSKAKVKVNILDQFDDETYRSTSKVKPSLDTMRHVPELYQMTDFMTRHGSLLLCAILV
jgi:hypothetical protein